jgi:hypothetical protein
MKARYLSKALSVVLGLTLTLAASCKYESPTQSTSEINGFLPEIEKLVSIPKPKPAKALQEFADFVINHLSRSALAGSSASSKVHPVQAFGAIYVDALVEVGGLPRAQGEKLVKQLVSPDSKLCGGVSCARLFGIDEQEVPDFFDAIFTYVASSTTLSEPNKANLRRVVLGSLMPEAAASSQSPWSLIASVYSGKPHALPRRTPPPQDLLSGLVMARTVDNDFIQAVQGYTYGDFRWIKMAETMTDADLLQTGLSSQEIKRWRSHVHTINLGLDKLPKFSGTIYRGVSDINGTTLATWIKAWRSKKTISLGQENNKALTSCTWDPTIAESFLGKNAWEYIDQDFSVIFVMTDHQGVSIEDISRFPGEHEVLLPSQHAFQIESILPLENKVKTLVVTLKGVKASAMQWMMPFKKAG